MPTIVISATTLARVERVEGREVHKDCAARSSSPQSSRGSRGRCQSRRAEAHPATMRSTLAHGSRRAPCGCRSRGSAGRPCRRSRCRPRSRPAAGRRTRRRPAGPGEARFRRTRTAAGTGQRAGQGQRHVAVDGPDLAAHAVQQRLGIPLRPDRMPRSKAPVSVNGTKTSGFDGILDPLVLRVRHHADDLEDRIRNRRPHGRFPASDSLIRWPIGSSGRSTRSPASD